MKRALLLIAVLILSPAIAQDGTDLLANDNLRVRAYTKPENQAYIGQQVELFIDITTDTWFNKAPIYPDLDLEGVIVLQPEQSSGNISEREGAKTYSGTRRRYLLYPQRAGDVVIPPIPLTPAVAVDGKPVEVTVTTQEIQVTAIMPELAAKLAQFVTTPKFTVEETYEPKPEALKVGDALTRTITTSAENALALLLPAIQFEAIDGLQVYPAQPKLNDKANRGRFSSSRIDAVTYILQQEGEIELPAIELYWWQPKEQKLHTETLPAVQFNVAAAPVTDTEAESELTQVSGNFWSSVVGRWARLTLDWLQKHLITITIIGGLLYLLSMLWHRYRDVMVSSWQAYRQRTQTSEEMCFRRFCWMCESGDEDKMLSAFWHWLDRLALPTSTVRTLVKTSQSRQFAECWRAIEQQRYAHENHKPVIASDDFMLQVAQIRQQLLNPAESKKTVSHDSRVLNP